MAPARLLERNVRPARIEDGGNEEDVQEAAAVSADESSDEEQSDVASISEDEDGASDGESVVDEDEGKVEQEISNVSFGALMQAQDAISRKRKRGSDTTAEQEEKLEAIRARLKEIRSSAGSNNVASQSKKERGERAKVKSANASQRAITNGTRYVDQGEEDDSDSGPSEEDAPTKSRSSKHAPASQSSKHQVTRKRTVVDVPKRVSRDPRFDALHQGSVHPGNNEKAYSFLRDYQKDEIAELKSAVKQARNEDDKEKLRRKLISMENRIKSQEAKEREQNVLRQHRKEEKQQVEQGKKPFYLKRKDVKERALVEKYQGMKGKEREKLLERRRLKESQKEKRRTPNARRVAG